MGFCLSLLSIGLISLFYFNKKCKKLSTEKATSIIILIWLILLFSLMNTLAYLKNVIQYDDTRDRVLDKHAAYSAVVNEPIAYAILTEEINEFNNNIQLAKRYDNFFFRGVFVSPAYSAVEEIQKIGE